MFSIPPDINKRSMADAFTVYRDTVGLHVYPVYPPWAPVKDAGKHPAIPKWWDADPHDCNIEKYFKTKLPFNIGACPEPPLGFVDLDSKSDRGVSVREYLSTHPELEKFPRHVSRGGAHLVFICEDLPVFLDEHGNRYMSPLLSQINEKVSAELFYHPHQNLVLPCSLHPLRDSEKEPYFVYHWERTGDIPKVTWKWLQDTFGFKVPEHKPKERSKKKVSWYLQFRGDLASLDLVKLLEELGHSPEIANVDEGKYSLLCPWHTEHSNDDGQIDGTSAVIWQSLSKDHWPGFKCKHVHCESAGRSLQELLEWAESKTKGIVDRHCTLQRIWDQSAREHTGKKGLPRVLHAEDRLESTVYTEVGKLIAPHHVWFNRSSQIVRIEIVPSGFSYSADPKSRYKIETFTPGFRELAGIQAKGLLEKYMEPGVLRKDQNEQPVFIPRSFTTDFCAGMVKSDQLKSELDHISRILTVPLPFLVDNRLVYPHKGFDLRFGTYLLPDAPELDLAMPITEAWKLIADILVGFCFTNEQSRTHAIARMLTPFGRAIMGWTARVPLWAFIGSRPRCGKDYLSGCTLTIYEGQAYEDQAISGRDTSPETAKRILSAGRNGRRFMHFSNCSHNLKDNSLTQAATMPYISGRNLGTNDASADVTIPNEMEYSVSFNLGLIIAPDIAPRTRPIELAFYEEDPNSRTFPNPRLHQTHKAKRAQILSAFAAIFKQWGKDGFQKGLTPFASFVEWAEIIGGVMRANREHMYAAFDPLPLEDGTTSEKAAKPPESWGDPCRAWGGKFADAVADRETAAMRALFIACRATFEESSVKNKEIVECVIKHQQMEEAEAGAQRPSTTKVVLTDAEVDALSYFGQLESGEDAHGNKITLIRRLRTFNGRILAGIKLKIESAGRAARDLYRFESQPNPPSPTSFSSEADVKTHNHHKAVSSSVIPPAPDTAAPECRALPALRGLSDLAASPPKIVIDTREQDPLFFTHLRSERGSLVIGDYAIKGAEKVATIERKSIADLVMCCGPERERFERELLRMKAYSFRRLVIIGNRAEIELQRYRSRMAPKAILNSLAAFEVRYDLPICYFPDAQAAATQVETWLWWVSREITRAANNLLRGSSDVGATDSIQLNT
jgi:DNA excision repair protein ERCC-4